MAKHLAFVFAIAALLSACEDPTSSATTMHPLLSSFAGKDHFSAEPNGLYTGVADPQVRAALNSAVIVTASALAQARASGASDDEVLALLKDSLFAIDRDSLDTEDAERVAIAFEQLLDAAELESSNGLLNNWLYGFDPG